MMEIFERSMSHRQTVKKRNNGRWRSTTSKAGYQQNNHSIYTLPKPSLTIPVYLSDNMLDQSNPSLHLHLLPYQFYTLQYPVTTPIPWSLPSSTKYDVFSLTRTPEEISIIFSLTQSHEGKELKGIESMGEAKEVAGPWGCIKVVGPMDLSTPKLPTPTTR